MRDKVGILGGTFDPVHFGHLAIAEKAYEFLGLSRVLFIPSANSHKKINVSDITDRVNMTQSAISGNSHFELSLIEANSSENSYSYKTILKLKELYKDTDFFFILGADAFLNLGNWVNADLIFKNVKVVVASRNDTPEILLTGKIGEYSSKFGADCILLPADDIDISSVNIRNMIRNEQSVKGLTPEKVIEYINKKCLYKDNQNGSGEI